MKEGPILFSGPMVRAILEGRKTQTRRVIKPQPVYSPRERKKIVTYPAGWTWKELFAAESMFAEEMGHYCPYGAPGDRLWVREAWAIHGMLFDDLSPSAATEHAPQCVWYRASGEDVDATRGKCDASQRGKWRPSIHVPRWASRTTLDVTAVRVERLQDISPLDAVAEGVFEAGNCHTEPPLPYPVATFKQLWDSINAKRGYPWADNPWVWVVEFRRSDSDAG